MVDGEHNRKGCGHAEAAPEEQQEVQGQESRSRPSTSATASSATIQRGPQGTSRGMGRLALSANWSHRGGMSGAPSNSPIRIPGLGSGSAAFSIVLLSMFLPVAPVRKHLLSPCCVPVGAGVRKELSLP